MLVTCSVIVSDHNVKLAGHFQNLVGQCPPTVISSTGHDNNYYWTMKQLTKRDMA